MFRKVLALMLCIAAVVAVVAPVLQVQVRRSQYRQEMRAWMRSEQSLKRDTIPVDFPDVVVEDAHEISIHGVMYDVLGVTWHHGKPSWICVEDSYEKTAFREIQLSAGKPMVDASHPGKADLRWIEFNAYIPTIDLLPVPEVIQVCLCEKGDPAVLSGYPEKTKRPPKEILRS